MASSKPRELTEDEVIGQHLRTVGGHKLISRSTHSPEAWERHDDYNYASRAMDRKLLSVWRWPTNTYMQSITSQRSTPHGPQRNAAENHRPMQQIPRIPRRAQR